MNINFETDLKDKTVVITGGGGVLMSEFGKTLASYGAKVALLDINENAAKVAADNITKEGGSTIGVKCNCLDKISIFKAKDIITEKYGKTDILINGAGGNNPKGTTDIETMTKNATGKTFFDLDAEGLRFVFDLNILSAFLVTQVFAQDMVQNKKGNIINISSMNAFKPLTKIPAYSAAKAGVSNFTQWLAVHFAPCNIRVNAIAPGFFVTNQNRALLFDKEKKPTKRADKILKHTPLNRFGEIADLAGTLLLLATDSASGFVTGTIIPVDGGFSAYSGV